MGQRDAGRRNGEGMVDEWPSRSGKGGGMGQRYAGRRNGEGIKDEWLSGSGMK